MVGRRKKLQDVARKRKIFIDVIEVFLNSFVSRPGVKKGGNEHDAEVAGRALIRPIAFHRRGIIHMIQSKQVQSIGRSEGKRDGSLRSTAPL
jgi:hypothetical protein